MQTDVLHKGTALGAMAPGENRRFEWSWLVIALCVGLTVYIALVPLGFLLWQSFFTPQTASQAAVFTLGNYKEGFGRSETAGLFWSSLKFAAGPAVFSFVVGPALAWMNER